MHALIGASSSSAAASAVGEESGAAVDVLQCVVDDIA